MNTGFPTSQRDSASQPRATPWEWGGGYGCVLKERRIGSLLAGVVTVCGVPSERGNPRGQIPGALPRAGMRGSVGAGITCAAGVQNQPGKTLCRIADDLRGSMNEDDLRDCGFDPYPLCAPAPPRENPSSFSARSRLHPRRPPALPHPDGPTRRLPLFSAPKPIPWPSKQSSTKPRSNCRTWIATSTATTP